MVDKAKWDKHDKLVDWTHYYNSDERHQQKPWGTLEHQEVIVDTLEYIREKNEDDPHDYGSVHRVKTKKITCPICSDVRQITHSYDGPGEYNMILDEEERFDEITMGGLCPDCVRTLEKIREDEGRCPKWHKYWELPPL